jgi:PAS domain S-box-containing protein
MTGERILIVEDEGIVADDIKSRLIGLGYAVTGVAMTGEEAIRLAFETYPDLILMDIMLRGEMDGIGAANRIKDRMDVPIVYLTAYGDDETLQRAKVSQPFGYVLKPFKERELHTTIEISLYRYRMERELHELGLRYNIITEMTTDFSFSVRIEPDRLLTFEWPMNDFTRITGYSAEEIGTPDDFLKLIPVEDQTDVLKRLDSHLSGTAPYFECRIRTKEGEIRWVRCYAKAIRNEVLGRLIRVYGAAQDITTYKEQEENMEIRQLELEQQIMEMNRMELE